MATIVPRWGLILIVSSTAVTAALLWDAWTDIEDEHDVERRSREHQEQAIAAELARIERAFASTPPKTLGAARRLIGVHGECGEIGKIQSHRTQARWRARASIPLADARVWPNDDETSVGLQGLSIGVPTCDASAPIEWINFHR
jgi:hypothetical protein